MAETLPRHGLGDVASDRAFFGHPRGLATLFFTEMWERFSYYGMRALLILFMVAPESRGGLGIDTPTAGAIYGMYTAMVYMMTLPGGWIADRLIGQRRAVLYGGILITCGHFSMAVPSLSTFYAGLVLIVLGTGLLKPNISVIVGQLYAADDRRRDAGFSIFYMGINAGAFVAPLICGYLGQRVDWHYGFAAAGVGMLLGLIQYGMGSRALGQAGLAPALSTPADRRDAIRLAGWTSGVATVMVAVFAGLVMTGTWSLSGGQIANAAGYLLLIITVVFFAWLYLSSGWTREERGRLYVIGVFFLAAALFWSVFEQAGSTLNLFADERTRNELFGFTFPSSWYQSLNPIFIIALAPVFGWLWVKLGSREPASPLKFSIGLIGVGIGFAILIPAAEESSTPGTLVSPLWLVATYLIHTMAELCLSPVGLSSMSKLAPARILSLMMGVWFLAASVGNYIGGQLSGFYGSLPLSTLFGVVGLFAIAAGLTMLLLSGTLTRLMTRTR